MRKLTDEVYLDETEDGLGLRAPHLFKSLVMVDFVATYHALKKTGGFGRKSLLAKALGGAKDDLVWDLTAGLGRDSLTMAAMGYRVRAFERSEPVFELLCDGVHRAEVDPEVAEVLKRVEFVQGEALSSLEGKEKPDFIYLDPMYPEKKKSALPSKEMQVLQALLGHEDDFEALLVAARRHACKRVVVKRPPSVEKDQNASHSYLGKAVRFDMYLTPAANLQKMK